MHMDAYALLGLAPGAGEREIKRAFRRLAMLWHPDRNPDPAALEHFKTLRAAHDSLLAGLEDDGNHSDDVGDPPADPAPAAEPGPRRGPDRREDLHLTLEEACLGCEKNVRILREAPCANCDGSGEEVLPHTRLCAACHGTGRLRSTSGLVPCDTCAGRGYVSKRACSACHGSGRAHRGRAVSVKVPPGVLPGDELRLTGQGDPHDDAHAPRGDLRLRIVIAEHPLFTLDGRNLILTRPVSALRMLIGGDLRVPHPAGPRSVLLPAGPAHAREFRVEGAGFPGRRGQVAGDLVVRLEPVLPENPDDAARKLIAKLDAQLGRDAARHLPELAEWEAQWL